MYRVLSMHSPLLAGTKVGRNNERVFVIEDPDGAAKLCQARPKTVESCRGDAPHRCKFFSIIIHKRFRQFLL